MKTKINELINEIKKHNEAYYKNDNPLISDSEYDSLKAELKSLKEKYPDLVPDDVLDSVGYKVLDEFQKVKHSIPMLSLNNGFSNEDISDFINRCNRFLGLEEGNPIELFCEPKIDGLSFSARYENGFFVQGATRGDGQTGEDITENLKVIKNFPLKIDTNIKILEVRGEIYMSKADFETLNQEQEKNKEKIFANPRNAAAGSLRQLDTKITANRNLKYFVYTLGEYSDDFNIQSQKELFDYFKSLNFSITDFTKLCKNLDEVIEFYNKAQEIRHSLDYDVDGLVYKVNSFELQKRLGFVTHHPRWALAHKFPPKQAITEIKQIIIQVGRTGSLTPVAKLDPVNIGGALVSNATLHNKDEIERKDIREGDIVVIQRAGDVIPQVAKVLIEKRKPESKPYIFPTKCPICGSPAESFGEDVVIRCTGGMNCPAQVVEGLKHFVSKDAFDIEGLGDKQIERFYEEGRIKSFIDIFNLPEKEKELEKTYKKEDLLFTLIPEAKNPNIDLTNYPAIPIRYSEGWGDKSANNLFKAIEEAKNISLEKFIYALGIRFLGESTAILLAKNYNSINNLLMKIQEACKTDLFGSRSSDEYNAFVSIDGIGEKTANTILDYFSDNRNIERIKELTKKLNISNYVNKNKSGKLEGMTILFTGTMNSMTRAEAKARAEELGAKVISAISSKTSLLVVGEDGGSKVKKAAELGVKMINENEWLELINNKN